MVLIPWGRDQPGVAARARALGVAEVVKREEASAATIAATVDVVLAEERMRKAAERLAARLRATDPPQRAAKLLKALV
jgi:UDP:flavonoid glycosyltransferase YjiC (YdhE family)